MPHEALQREGEHRLLVDQIVVRRAFAPGEYLSGAANLGSGIAGNAELTVKLFIDASTTSQAGYQVYLFYP